MALSEKKAITDKKHLDKLDKMKIQPYKEEGAKIRAAAEQAGQSLQGYILQAVRTRMLEDEEGNGVVKNSESELLSSEIAGCLLSPNQEKALKDAVKDIVLDTSPNPEKRKMLKTELLRIVNETVDECDKKSRKPIWCESKL